MKNKNETDRVPKAQYVPDAEFYSQVVDSLQDYSVFTIDLNLNINSWNSGATHIFQYTTAEIIGKPFETIFSDEDRDYGVPQKEIELTTKNGRCKDIRWHVRKDGSTFYADGLVFQLKDSTNAVTGFVKILRDITKKKESEDAIKSYAKELEDLNAHKENVLAILSHDLRSPLAAIIQGAEFMSSNFNTMDSSLAKELLDEFHTAAVNELEMLDYLVAWARIKYAAEAFSPAKTELNTSVEKVFGSLKESASLRSVKFRTEIAAGTLVFADEKMLLSILHNLVSNAIKHSHKGGQITLLAKKSEEMLVVEVKDTGTGMSKETKDKLFTPQIKSLSKSVEAQKKMGIGLLLVKGFLEKNSGDIWVESTEGSGSSFYFTLPVDKPSKSIDVFAEVSDRSVPI